jgi:imidazole glycerol-phosphate synthase subunit HisH
MKAILFDYGAGNLHSLGRALEAVGVTPAVEADPVACAASSDLLVLPGVGAFGLAAERLRPGREALKKQLLDGRPCLGICLGLQLFFDSSEEGGGEGLGVIPGAVTRLTAKRCPHIGWTRVDGLTEMYFAHSFACRPVNPEVVTAWAEHDGDRIASVVKFGRIAGTQFHPEKSSKAGLALLRQLIHEITS